MAASRAVAVTGRGAETWFAAIVATRPTAPAGRGLTPLPVDMDETCDRDIACCQQIDRVIHCIAFKPDSDIRWNVDRRKLKSPTRRDREEIWAPKLTIGVVHVKIVLIQNTICTGAAADEDDLRREIEV
jgi:hypothetical protein